MITIYIMMYMYSVITTTQNENQRENFYNAKFELIRKSFPELNRYIVDLSTKSKKDIKKYIHIEVQQAYNPVYKEGINRFSDYHYTVIGEYTELFSNLAGKENFEKIVYEKLFNSVNFEANIKNININININTYAIEKIKKDFSKLHNKIQSDLNTSNEQTDIIFEQIFQMGIYDMNARFQNKITAAFRASGVTGGSIVATLASKQIIKMVAKKFGTKIIVKGASKAAGVGLGVSAGASGGLLCGPGAFLCSPIEAIIGGIAGWFATDAIVTAGDEYFNKDKFKAKLRAIVSQQQSKTEEQIYDIYTKTIREFTIENRKKLEDFKHKMNKDNL